MHSIKIKENITLKNKKIKPTVTAIHITALYNKRWQAVEQQFHLYYSEQFHFG